MLCDAGTTRGALETFQVYHGGLARLNTVYSIFWTKLLLLPGEMSIALYLLIFRVNLKLRRS